MKERSIGIEVPFPKNKCEDTKCPFHGNLKVRGRTFKGTIISAKAAKSATVVWERIVPVRKFERFERKRSKVHAYNPTCIDAKEGDIVKIIECRPLSKTKHFVVIEKILKDDSVKKIEMHEDVKKEETKKKEAKKEDKN